VVGRCKQTDEPSLKATKYLLLKLMYDGPLSDFALNFNLRHYTVGADARMPVG